MACAPEAVLGASSTLSLARPRKASKAAVRKLMFMLRDSTASCACVTYGRAKIASLSIVHIMAAFLLS
jgi:hypothetical protein